MAHALIIVLWSGPSIILDGDHQSWWYRLLPSSLCVWSTFYFFRLWHQLTLQVLDFVQDPCFAQGDGLIKVMTCHTRSDYVEHTQRLFFFNFSVCWRGERKREHVRAQYVCRCPRRPEGISWIWSCRQCEPTGIGARNLIWGLKMLLTISGPSLRACLLFSVCLFVWDRLLPTRNLLCRLDWNQIHSQPPWPSKCWH